MKNKAETEIEGDLNSIELSESSKCAIENEFRKYTANNFRTYIAMVLGILFVGLSLAGRLVIENPTDKENGGLFLFLIGGIGLLSEARSNSHRIKMRNAVIELIKKRTSQLS